MPSTHQRHLRGQCVEGCYYCAHAVQPKPVIRHKDSRLSYKQLTELCVTLAKKLETYEPVSKISA